jgi:hypothetical protein
MSLAMSSALISKAKRRRQVNSINKSKAIKAFRSSRAHYNAGKPNSSKSFRFKGEGPPKMLRKKRYITYSREKKLQAITYITLTDMPKKGRVLGEIVPITLTYISA